MKLNLADVPKKPGVYMWLDNNHHILYIGKANNLKNRMSQYFTNTQNSYKTADMVSKICHYKYIITNNSKEALILERGLIDKSKPPYNIRLIDNKSYPYIKVELKEKVVISLSYKSKVNRKNTFFYGPFPTGYGAKTLTNLLQRLITFENGLPSKNTDKEYWRRKYQYATKLLSGNNKGIINDIESQMNEASSNKQYEVAKILKDTLTALNHFKEDQGITTDEKRPFDVIGFVENNGFLFITQLMYRLGNLLFKKEIAIEIRTGTSETINEFTNHYYSGNQLPSFLVSNRNIKLDGIKTLIPQRGIYKKILDIALVNADDNKENKKRKIIREKEITTGAINKLESILNLKKVKNIIMVDNSNFNNTNPVSAFVSYVNGQKNSNGYRKFKVDIRNRKADVDYLEQGIMKFISQNKDNIDLFIIDGSIQQVNVAKKIIKNIPIIGLAKNEKHKTEKIITADGSVIDINDDSLHAFLSNIQEEVDRYAKTYQRKNRLSSLEGELINIRGVDKKTEEKLLRHFKTYSNIYNATIEELKEVVSENIAIKIKENL